MPSLHLFQTFSLCPMLLSTILALMHHLPNRQVCLSELINLMLQFAYRNMVNWLSCVRAFVINERSNKLQLSLAFLSAVVPNWWYTYPRAVLSNRFDTMDH